MVCFSYNKQIKGRGYMSYKDNPEKLLSPEYYMEIENYDVRLAVLKINDFLETLGDATLSLIYSDKSEHENIKGLELNLVRRIHIRHAIIDFNNCFDILLQIPWFYYRGWKEFNRGGAFYNKKAKIKEVVRNTDGWVETAEENCQYFRVKQFLESYSDQEIVDFKEALEDFNNTFRFNENKNVVVREIANQIKHKNSLKIAEMNTPYNVDLTLNGQKINMAKIKEKNLGLSIKRVFFDLDSNKELGEVIINLEDDLIVDIKYKSGETFRGKDYLKSESVYDLDDIHNELVAYREAIIRLYEKLHNLIEPNLSLNPALNLNINKTSSINLDKYFKA